MKDLAYMHMLHRFKLFIWLLPLLISMLACNYVTRMIVPVTPAPTATLPPTRTATVPPTAAEAPEFQAACPSLLSEILVTATSYQNDSVLFSERRRIYDGRDLRYLVTYSVQDDQLDTRRDVTVPDSFERELNQRVAHEWIWNYFAALIPFSERDFLVEFSAMSDGSSRILASVHRTYDDPDEWSLRVDVLDARDRYELTYTFMHEFGHLLTLKAAQVQLDRSVYLNPNDEDVFAGAQDSCPDYFAGDGCSLPGSYLTEFVNRYWTPLLEEWQKIDQLKDSPSYEDELHDFYRMYVDQFLTEYAATSPEEDIAESWSFFVLSPKPELNSIANEKILIFYEYPELVELRQEILTRICLEFPQ